MKYIVFVMLLTLLMDTFSCAQKPPVLKLVTEDYPPLTYAVGDSVMGFGAEVVKAIQAEVKSSDKIKIMDWSTAYNTALNEPNVIIFTMEKTPERDTSFYWVGPLGKNKTYLYAKADTTLVIRSLEEAKFLKTIATTTDWFSEKYLQKNGFTNLISNYKPTDAVKLIMSGDADAAVFTDLTVNQIVRQAGYEPGALVPVFELLDTDFYIGISKLTDKKIVDKWTKAFEKIKQEGTLTRLQNKFLR